MKKTLILLFLSVVAALAAAAQENLYQINIGDFNELTVADDLPVVYRCVPDSAGVVVFRTNPAYVADLSFEIKNFKLRLQNDGERPDSVFGTITVYSTTLNSATNWGNSTITVASLPPLTSFKAKVIGNGSVVVPKVQATKVTAVVQAGHGRVFIAGKTYSASLQLMSTGSIEAGSLAAAVVRCRMYGTGSIDCMPSDELSVAGLTSGTVYYKGTPAKVVNRSIGAHIVNMNQQK